MLGGFSLCLCMFLLALLQYFGSSKLDSARRLLTRGTSTQEPPQGADAAALPADSSPTTHREVYATISPQGADPGGDPKVQELVAAVQELLGRQHSSRHLGSSVADLDIDRIARRAALSAFELFQNGVPLPSACASPPPEPTPRSRRTKRLAQPSLRRPRPPHPQASSAQRDQAAPREPSARQAVWYDNAELHF